MNKKVLRSSITLAFFLVALFSGFGSGAPARTSATAPAPPAAALSYLPASDAITLIDVRRLLNETMPSILAGDQAKLATANGDGQPLERGVRVRVESVEVGDGRA